MLSLETTGIITRSVEASFKSRIAAYKESADAYVISIVADSLEEDIKDKIYSGDTTANTSYGKMYRNIDAIAVANSQVITNRDIDNIIHIQQEEDRVRIAIVAGDLTWFANSYEDEEVAWCLSLGLKVFVDGMGFVTESGEYLVYSKGEYSIAAGSSTYCCAPDLTGFNTGATNYIVYKDNKQEYDGSVAIYNQVPSGWYDYGTQNWANIICVEDNHVVYLTWIPRFMYKKTSATTDDYSASEAILTDVTQEVAAVNSSGKTDVVFVDLDNNCGAGDSKIAYAQLQAEGYVLPDAFKFGGENLSGFWITKYEISDPFEPVGMVVDTGETDITIKSINWKGASYPDVRNEEKENKGIITITKTSDGTEIYSSGTAVELPKTFSKDDNYNIEKDTKYTIEIIVESYYGSDKITLTQEVKTAAYTLATVTAPDLRGFDLNKTYLVNASGADPVPMTTPIGSLNVETPYYDSDKLVLKQSAMPENFTWFNYEATEKEVAEGETVVPVKQWANIVTQNADGDLLYLVWIPRFKYSIDSKGNISVLFIPRSDTEEKDGYRIPDAFKYGSDGKTQLAGIWVSKYELQSPYIPVGFTTRVAISGSGSNITRKIVIENVVYAGVSGLTGNRTISKDGITITLSGAESWSGTVNIPAAGYEIDKSLSGGWYTVKLEMPNTYDTITGTHIIKTSEQKIYVPSTNTAAAPDVSKFVEEGLNVYYVDYGSNGKTQDGTIRALNSSNEVPADSYDYDNQIWSTILISEDSIADGTKLSSFGTSTGTFSLFVWIPRYMYSIQDESTQVVFIGNESGDPKPGTPIISGSAKYVVPDAFEYGGVQLSGIWVSKYELSGTVQDRSTVISAWTTNNSSGN